MPSLVRTHDTRQRRHGLDGPAAGTRHWRALSKRSNGFNCIGTIVAKCPQNHAEVTAGGGEFGECEEESREQEVVHAVLAQPFVSRCRAIRRAIGAGAIVPAERPLQALDVSVCVFSVSAWESEAALVFATAANAAIKVRAALW